MRSACANYRILTRVPIETNYPDLLRYGRGSHLDLTAIMDERGIRVAPSTTYRWVQHFIPEFKRRWDRLAKPVGTSWRVDETYVSIRGQWH